VDSLFLFFTQSAFTCNILFNLFSAELNPICHLLALLEAHHIPHVSRIRVKDFSFGVVPAIDLTLGTHCLAFSFSVP
jgi:hypothetical protein